MGRWKIAYGFIEKCNEVKRHKNPDNLETREWRLIGPRMQYEDEKGTKMQIVVKRYDNYHDTYQSISLS